MTIGMNAPNLQPFFTVVAKSTTVYVANANGVIANVAPRDINDLEGAGCVRLPILIGPAKFGTVHTRKTFASQGGQLGGANFTLSTAWALEAPFSFVRVVLYNHTNAAVTYAKVFGQVSAQLNDYVNPMDGSGNLLTPTQFTFNTGAQGLPPSASGATTSVTVPAAISGAGAVSAVPGAAYSDWMPFASLPRTDGGILPLFFTRFWDNTQPILDIGDTGPTGSTAFDGVDLGRTSRSYYASGDTTASTSMSSATRNNQAPYLALQYISQAGGLTVLGCGDSITDGFTSTGQANSFGHQGCAAVSTPQFPVSWVNAGQPGQGTPQIQTNAMNRMKELTPDVIVLPVYSPNDHPITQATVETSYAYAMAVVAYAVQNNIVPILWTGLPGPTATTLAQDAFRIGINNRLRAAAVNSGGRFLVADFDTLMTDGGIVAGNGGICRIQTQYTTTDSTFVHPNDLGHSVMAQQALIPLLQKIMSCRPN